MNNVVIVSATRTAVGKFGGSLKDFSPGQLGSVVLKDALKKVNVEQSEVEEIIMGNVLCAGHGRGKTGCNLGRNSKRDPFFLREQSLRLGSGCTIHHAG